MTTHFSGPVESTNGFIGDVTGDISGDVTGEVISTIVNSAVDGAIAPATEVATISKGTAAALTLAAPGASKVGKRLLIISKTAAAHVITITGLDSTENTLTFGAVIGESVELYAQTALLWSVISLNGVTASTV